MRSCVGGRENGRGDGMESPLLTQMARAAGVGRDPEPGGSCGRRGALGDSCGDWRDWPGESASHVSDDWRASAPHAVSGETAEGLCSSEETSGPLYGRCP